MPLANFVGDARNAGVKNTFIVHTAPIMLPSAQHADVAHQGKHETDPHQGSRTGKPPVPSVIA
jgi:hypothetical protein